MEHFAQITLVARQLGRVNVLSDRNVQKLMEVREKLGIKGKNPMCRQCTQACPNQECGEAQTTAVAPTTRQEALPKADEVGEADEQVVQRITERVMAALKP